MIAKRDHYQLKPLAQQLEARMNGNKFKANTVIAIKLARAAYFPAEFGASAPGQVHVKTGAPTRIGAAVFSFEWIVSGFTAVCFWTAPSPVPPKLQREGGPVPPKLQREGGPVPPKLQREGGHRVSGLEGPVRSGLGHTLPGPIESE